MSLIHADLPDRKNKSRLLHDVTPQGRVCTCKCQARPLSVLRYVCMVFLRCLESGSSWGEALALVRENRKSVYLFGYLTTHNCCICLCSFSNDALCIRPRIVYGTCMEGGKNTAGSQGKQHRCDFVHHKSRTECPMIDLGSEYDMKMIRRWSQYSGMTSAIGRWSAPVPGQ